nr:MFS transporter [Actinomyces provencensis]
MIGLFLTQVLMSFNVAALPVSMGGMVEDFDVPSTTVSTAIVTYGLVVAALVMVGAKLGRRVGWSRIFRTVIVVFGISSAMMVTAPSVGWVIAAQGLAGASAAVIVPSLVPLIAENYHGDQQATAIGSLGSARAISGVSAFFIGGALGTLVGWRPVFGVTLALAVAVFLLSFRLRGDEGDPEVSIDVLGALFIGCAIVSLTLGFNNLNGWGVLRACGTAPFDILGVSTAPLLVLIGVVLAQAFLVWTRHREAQGRPALVSLSVVGSAQERAAVVAMFVVVSLEAALNFTVPLYIQIVQGRTPFATSVAMMPFNLTVFITALLVVRLYRRFTPPPDRGRGLRPHDLRPGLALLRGDEQLADGPDDPGTRGLRDRTGCPRHPGLQRAGDRLAEGTRRGRRVGARDHPEPRLRGGDRGGRCPARLAADARPRTRPGRA